jgi:hypothetical protein
MNVQNRKLFRNKDARRQLAAMGGIMRSSPELMGEAMRFANGGGVELSYIVSNIPGLVDQYEYVRVDVPTMQMLNDRFPQLMQQATVEEESMVPSGVRTRARPQTILGTRISRMMETQQAAPEEVVLESAPITSGEQPSLMDRIRTTVQSAQSVNPIEDALREISLNPPSLSFTPTKSMEDIMAGRSVAENQGIPIEDASLALAGMTMPTPAETLMSMTPEEDPASLRQIQVQGMPFLVNERTNQVFTMDMDPILSTDARSKMVTEFMSSADFKQQEAERLKNEASIAQQQQQQVVEDQTFGGVPLSSEAAVDLAAAEKRVSEASEAASAATEGDILTRAQEMADAERKQMTGMPDLAAPEKVDVDALLEAVEKNDPKAESAAALGSAGYTPDAAKDLEGVALAAAEASKDPGASLPGTIGANLGAGSSSSIEEATKAQYEFLKDFLGIGERDKQKEFNLMAMQFFTALAAGQSPDALANLNAAASTAIAGLAAADKERTELDRSIKLAAFDRASELDSAAAARRQRMDELIKEYQLRTDLEIAKIETDAANTPGKAFLSTATGKALLAEYNLYIDPASGGLTPDQAFEKMTSSGGVARDPALITLFMKSLGYTSNNQGKTDGATKFDQRQKKGS